MALFHRGFRSGRRAFGQLGREAPLQLFFEKFHQLLEYNNRVLEIIAEAGEMLNGEYIFDASYIRGVCEELSSLLSRIIYNLNVVGQGKHLELFQVYEGIKQRIDAELLDNFSLPEGDYVVSFKYLDRSKANLSGNKAGVLGELRSRLKVLVPPGFVITTRAYRSFLEANGLRAKIEKLLEPMEQNASVSLEAIPAEVGQLIAQAVVPPELVKSIEGALAHLEEEWKHGEPRYAVRSSAVGEDAQLSFAGQYSTFLNVPGKDVVSSYKKVVASLFGSNALSYRKQKNIPYSQTPMAVAVMPMLNPTCSGIMYSVDPNSAEGGNCIISAVWGLGQMVADGEGESDYYVVTRRRPHIAVQRSVACKPEAYKLADGEGVLRKAVDGERQQKPCLSDGLLSRLAELALQIEKYFGQPQDIEWALDSEGSIYILQARPLLISDNAVRVEGETSSVEGSYPVLMKAKGVVACRGIGAGKAYHVYPSDSGSDFPEGAVLVARSTSPRLSSLISRASAVVTDIGTPTGHMATIAREFRVPMIVDTGDATRVIRHGDEVTVDANNNIVYGGTAELIRSAGVRHDPFLDSPEFCKLRDILKHVAPLHLVDPHDKATFRAEKCRSYHDIIRFSHEMVVKELIEMNLIRKRHKAFSTKHLNFSLPIGLILIDVGNGLKAETSRLTTEVDNVNCVPLRMVLDGLLVPGIWSTKPVPLSFRDFMAGMGHTGDPTVSQPEYGGRSLAIISNTYLNLSLRFGYHFTMVDCVASEKRSANYIYFRFVGGITEMARRKRRAQFLSNVLSTYDFSVSVSGDLVVARIAKVSLPMMEERLLMLGRLIGFSRQLDILMRSDEAVGYYTHEFLKGDLKLVSNETPHRFSSKGRAT